MGEGLFSRLFGSNKTQEPGPAVPVYQGRADVEVAGEAYHRGEIATLFRRWGMPEGGVTMRTATLVPEPTNQHDRNAVKVVIDGLLVGYVPAEDAPRIGRECRRIPPGAVATTPVRMWGTNDDGTWRARITLAFSGIVEPERNYAAERADQREAAARDEAARRVGQVRGQWWSIHRAAVAELKRQGRLDEALALLGECAAAALRVSVALGEAPDPWPTEQAAIVLRKKKDPVQETQVLEAYITACGTHPVPDKIMEGLNRARIAAGE